MIAFACIAGHAYYAFCNCYTSFSQHGRALWFEYASQSRFDPLVSEPSEPFFDAQTHSGILALVRMHDLRCASFCPMIDAKQQQQQL